MQWRFTLYLRLITILANIEKCPLPKHHEKALSPSKRSRDGIWSIAQPHAFLAKLVAHSILVGVLARALIYSLFGSAGQRSVEALDGELPASTAWMVYAVGHVHEMLQDEGDSEGEWNTWITGFQQYAKDERLIDAFEAMLRVGEIFLSLARFGLASSSAIRQRKNHGTMECQDSHERGLERTTIRPILQRILQVYYDLLPYV